MDQQSELEYQGYTLPGTTAGKSLQGTRGGNAQKARARGRKVIYAASGGEIKSFCEMKIPHRPDCEYFAEGGLAVEPPVPAHPSITLGHSAAHHGLLGILKNVGKETLANPQKHRKSLEKVRDHVSAGNHEKAIDFLHGHPLTGGAARGKVEPVVHRLGSEIVNKEIAPGAFRSASDYLTSAMKGNDALENHVGTLFDHQKKADKLKPDEKSRKELNDLLKKYQEDPQSMLDVAGSIGHYLPEHASELGALASTASDYLNTLRPKEKQISPLDEPITPDESAVEQFDRQLDIAQNPLLVLQHLQHGTLIPGDIKTLSTLYPALHKSIIDKSAETLIDAKANGKEIPYEQSVSLGLLLGQPLESSMTPEGMQAIMRANSAGTTQQQAMPQKKSKSDRPTAAQIKQIDKTDDLYQTPIESRQLDKKS